MGTLLAEEICHPTSDCSDSFHYGTALKANGIHNEIALNGPPPVFIEMSFMSAHVVSVEDPNVVLFSEYSSSKLIHSFGMLKNPYSLICMLSFTKLILRGSKFMFLKENGFLIPKRYKSKSEFVA